MFFSCNNDKEPCEEDICPTVFNTIKVKVINSSNNRVTLDSFKVINPVSKEDLTPPPAVYPANVLLSEVGYPLISDNTIPYNTTINLTFIGYLDSLEITENYQVMENCCGVELLSGDLNIQL